MFMAERHYFLRKVLALAYTIHIFIFVKISCRGAAPATLQGAFLPLHPSLGACGPRIPR